jgi:hypothetical protein
MGSQMNEADEKDARRYRWLRANKFGMAPACREGPAFPRLEFGFDFCAYRPETHNADGLDAAIDAALAAETAPRNAASQAK